MGKIFVFDIDDTLIIHSPTAADYYKEDKKNTGLKKLINGIGAERIYIYTNGTYSHGEGVINALNLTNDIKKIYARDTIPFMKPLMGSFTFLPSQINIGQIKSFDDNVFSCTSLRDHSFFLFLLSRVLGYEPMLFI